MIIEIKLINKIEHEKKKLTDISEIFSGIKAYEVGKGNPLQTIKIRNEKLFTSNLRKSDSWSPFFDGKNIFQISNIME